MEKQIDKRKEKTKIIPPKRWDKKFFECKSLGPTPGLNKEGFWAKPDHNELNKEFQRQLKGKKNA